MAGRKKRKKTKKTVEALTHDEASRKNIPTKEFESVMRKDDQSPIRVAYERRNRDLDPQLVWRGKDEQDWSDLVVQAPPLFIQEKVHPKVLIDDLLRRTQKDEAEEIGAQLDLFADFNGLPDTDAKTEFYQHDANWTNRMILGDSLQVMASLAEREGLRGKVQCIYIDPPYGIKFNSNFQWSTTSLDVKDGKASHITREPEQVKAFRDTWRDGVHSYLTYLRDRLVVAHDLLSDSGSLFVQIGDENSHRVRAILDEVFGEENFVTQICIAKTSGLQMADALASAHDFVLQYAKNRNTVKYRRILVPKGAETDSPTEYFNVSLPDGTQRRMTKEERKGAVSLPVGARAFRVDNLTKPGPGSKFEVEFRGGRYSPGARWWGTTEVGMSRVIKAQRLWQGGTTVSYIRYLDDHPVKPLTNYWRDVVFSSRSEDKTYVVQTSAKVLQRCILMSTDPGDLVLDPTCGSGTAAYVAEQWGRRWITIDTSRVALALARARLMGARYPYYVLSDSEEGRRKQAELDHATASDAPTKGDLRQGFVYERVPHVTLKAIANNAEIDNIWDEHRQTMEPIRAKLNSMLGKAWEEWDIPRVAEATWSREAVNAHRKWWEERIACQSKIDESIGAISDHEYLYDKPYEDNATVRVAGPFTVESISPHRVLAVDEDDEVVDLRRVAERSPAFGAEDTDFAKMTLAHLETSGVQQARREGRVNFTSITPWPGHHICAEGRYHELDDDNGPERRAGIFVGPEFGTVGRQDLVAAAREAGDGDFDLLIACAFSYEAHATEFSKLGRIPVLKARMNADLHMADDLKNTGKGNLFVVFGEPDIDILDAGNDRVQVKVNGVDVFHPATGDVRSDGADGIACWFVDTDYNEESFFVRHAYFLGARDPYKALKSTLKAEINIEAWESLHSDTSRPFVKPESGRIAVKVINHLGDEVMKVFRV